MDEWAFMSCIGSGLWVRSFSWNSRQPAPCWIVYRLMDQTIWHDAEEIDHFLGYTAAHFLENHDVSEKPVC
jgi:hypothetical protein